jgi:Fe-S cluster assembly iron-binding protein IscA
LGEKEGNGGTCTAALPPGFPRQEGNGGTCTAALPPGFPRQEGNGGTCTAALPPGFPRQEGNGGTCTAALPPGSSDMEDGKQETIEVTDEAIDVLRRSLELGGIHRPAGVRLRAAKALGGGIDVQVELAEGPLEDETTVEVKGVRIFVDPEVFRFVRNPVVAVEPQHDVVVVRPSKRGERR